MPYACATTALAVLGFWVRRANTQVAVVSYLQPSWQNFGRERRAVWCLLQVSEVMRSRVPLSFARRLLSTEFQRVQVPGSTPLAVVPPYASNQHLWGAGMIEPAKLQKGLLLWETLLSKLLLLQVPLQHSWQRRHSTCQKHMQSKR